MLKNIGAKVTGGISGRTDYLVAGHKLIDGRQVEESKKYKDAVKKKTKILREDELDEFLQKKTDMTLEDLLAGGSVRLALQTVDEKEEIENTVRQAKKETAKLDGDNNKGKKSVTFNKAPVVNDSNSNMPQPSVKHNEKNTLDENDLWTTKVSLFSSKTHSMHLRQ